MLSRPKYSTCAQIPTGQGKLEQVQMACQWPSIAGMLLLALVLGTAATVTVLGTAVTLLQAATVRLAPWLLHVILQTTASSSAPLALSGGVCTLLQQHPMLQC